MTISLLRSLYRFFESSYENSSFERKKIHSMECESNDEFSILGEVEIRADTVAGIALTCIKRQPDSPETLINKLKNNSIYNSDVISNWLSVEKSEFPNFYIYIVSMETLNSALIRSLEKHINLKNFM